MPGHRYVQDVASINQFDPRMIEAQRRQRIVLYSLGLEGSWLGRTQMVAEAIQSEGEGLIGPAPSRSALTRWVERYEDVGLRGLIDIPSPGRRRSFNTEVEEMLTSIARRRPAIQPKRLLEIAKRLCRRMNLPVPGYHAVGRWLRSRPIEEVTMERYGTQATRADALPKSTYPTSAPGELLFVDETSIPIWIRIWHSTTQEWIAATAWAVVCRDHFSGAILSWWIKEPSEGNPHYANFTGLEVLATIAGATVPEFAPAFMQQVVIGDPKKIRMDGGGGIGGALRTIQAVDPEWVIRSTVRAPWTNGCIERAFRTIKERDLAEVVGWKSEWVPFDVEIDPRDIRTTRNTGTKRRVPYRHEVPVMSLPDIRQVRLLFNHVVAQYNRTPSRALLGDTPMNRYLKHAPAVSRERSMILTFLPEHNVSVFSHGVEIDNVKYQSDRLQLAFRQRSKVRVRVDPLGRGVFVYPQMVSAAAASKGLFVPPAIEFARTQDPVERAKRQTGVLSALREEVDAEREAHVRDAIGDDAYEAMGVAKDDRGKRIRRKSRKARQIEKQAARAEQVTLYPAFDRATPATDGADRSETSLAPVGKVREKPTERGASETSACGAEASPGLPKLKKLKDSRAGKATRGAASKPSRAQKEPATRPNSQRRRPLFGVRLVKPNLHISTPRGE